MAVYLITGLPATGKSTIGTALAEQGYRVIDADTEFGYYGHLMSETPVQLPEPRRIKRNWYAENGWIWDSQKVRQFLLQPHEAAVFVVGGARNEKKFYRHFDKIFLLQLPNDILRQRIQSRSDPYHNNDIFIQRMLVWNRAVAEQADNIEATLITSNEAVEASLAAILGALHDD